MGARTAAPGGGGTADIEVSAREIAAYLDKVRATTGADLIDLVGHSQGGLHAHLYLTGASAPEATDPGSVGEPHARHVARVVTLGSTLHGASPLGRLNAIARAPGVGAALDAFLGPSARQQVKGSDVIKALAEAPETLPHIDYTCIASRTDDTVRPAAAQHLTPADNVTNVWVQDLQPRSTVSHAELPSDPAVIALVLAALAD